MNCHPFWSVQRTSTMEYFKTGIYGTNSCRKCSTDKIGESKGKRAFKKLINKWVLSEYFFECQIIFWVKITHEGFLINFPYKSTKNIAHKCFTSMNLPLQPSSAKTSKSPKPLPPPIRLRISVESFAKGFHYKNLA